MKVSRAADRANSTWKVDYQESDVKGKKKITHTSTAQGKIIKINKPSLKGKITLVSIYI